MVVDYLLLLCLAVALFIAYLLHRVWSELLFISNALIGLAHWVKRRKVSPAEFDTPLDRLVVDAIAIARAKAEDGEVKP